MYAHGYFIDNEEEEIYGANMYLQVDFFKKIGKSRICIIREHYLDIFSESHRTRREKHVYSTPLHVAAARNQHLASVEELLNTEAIDKNAVNKYNETALLLSLKELVNDKIIDTLLKYDCDCTMGCSRGVTPLHVAAFENKVNLIQKFIQKGADVNAVTNIAITPLQLAVLGSNYEAVQELLDNGANPYLASNLEFTPLMLSLSYKDIDIRISELLCTYDINEKTTSANPIYCAIKSEHPLAEQLILRGADVNYVGVVNGQQTSCLIEAISLNHTCLFDLIWPRLNQDLFKTELRNFLFYFTNCCNLAGDNLVSCLKRVLTCNNGPLLVKAFRNNQHSSFLRIIFEQSDFRLSSENACDIICSLPIVYYDDIVYIYKKFKFSRELECLLKLYRYYRKSAAETYGNGDAFVDLMCYKTVQTKVYNLKDILKLFTFFTPDIHFRNHFYKVFSALATSKDAKLSKLITLYKLCDEIYSKRSIASLQELSRNRIRNILFKVGEKPYQTISDMTVPDIIKDILYLKVPIYF